MSPGVQTSLKKRARNCSCLPNQEEKRTEGKREVEKEGRKERRQDNPIMAYAKIPATTERPQGYIMRPISKSIKTRLY